MNKITEKEKQFLNDLISFINTNNYTPTIRELGRYVGLSSPATIKYYLGNLEEKGYIKRINNRKIEVLDNGYNK